MAAQVTSHGHVVTEMALQSTLRIGFDVLAKSEQLTWPVIEITVTGNNKTYRWNDLCQKRSDKKVSGVSEQISKFWKCHKLNWKL